MAPSLVLEHLQAIRADLSRVDSKVVAIQAQLNMLNEYMAAFFLSETHQDSELADIKERIDLIEQRLEIID